MRGRSGSLGVGGLVERPADGAEEAADFAIDERHVTVRKSDRLDAREHVTLQLRRTRQRAIDEDVAERVGAVARLPEVAVVHRVKRAAVEVGRAAAPHVVDVAPS